MNSKIRIVYPAVALKELTVFPNMITSFQAGRESSLASINFAEKSDNFVFLVKQRDAHENNPEIKDLHEMGTIAKIKQVLNLPGNITHVIIEGVERAYIREFFFSNGCMLAKISPIEAEDASRYENDYEAQARMKIAGEKYAQYLRITTKQPANEAVFNIISARTPGETADIIISAMVINAEKKQEILECIDESERLKEVTEVLEREIEILMIKAKIEEKVRNQMEANQREYYLREQLKAIQEELGDKDGLQALSEEYKKKAEERKLPDYVKEVVFKECDKFAKIPATSPESNVVRTYLENIFALPWTEETEEISDIKKSKKILDNDHYGLEKVKERIIEFLAVRQNNKNNGATIICLAGPPGVGKTSVARSIARASGRNYTRMSLGGIKDEAEIRGHRRTYIGAMPGRILSALKQAKSINPLILLDEVDKLTTSYNGDPAAALLEVLDPEQNSSFCDNYLEIPYDLSKVLFICTANDSSKIPGPLKDRMEVIELSSYTAEEKRAIAVNYLYPKQLKAAGLTKSRLKIDEAVFDSIIDGYTREAGVRSLERLIGKICRKAVTEILGGEKKSIHVTKNNIDKYIGNVKYKHLKANKLSERGVVRGLAWTSAGGETLEVEAVAVEGSGKIELTGNMGDVMKESAKTAVTFIRANSRRFNIDQDFYSKNDIHIHIPEGAVPKDGPSAGVTITTAVLSALTGAKAKNTVAMTGEVTITGRVLAIGGLKEKTIAAMQAGIETVVIPKDNIESLSEIPDTVKEKLEFKYAENVEDVFKYAFEEGESIWR